MARPVHNLNKPIVNKKATVEEIKGKYRAMLLTPPLIDIYWEQCKPLIEASLEKAQEEMNIDDIYQKALQQQQFIFVSKCDEIRPPDVAICVGASINNYPRYSSLMIDFIGGRDLTAHYDVFWRDIMGWARLINIRYIEAMVGLGMTKKLERLHFTKTYNVMRQDLDEM